MKKVMAGKVVQRRTRKLCRTLGITWNRRMWRGVEEKRRKKEKKKTEKKKKMAGKNIKMHFSSSFYEVRHVTRPNPKISFSISDLIN